MICLLSVDWFPHGHLEHAYLRGRLRDDLSEYPITCQCPRLFVVYVVLALFQANLNILSLLLHHFVSSELRQSRYRC